MKINSEYLEALRQEELLRARQSTATNAFDGLLAKESARQDNAAGALQDASQTTPTESTPLLEGTESAAEVAEAATIDSNPLTEQAVMEHLDSVLTQWESYASTLKNDSGQSGLRDAYGMLENISSQVGQLKQTMPELPEEKATLQSVVDELEIMTVTERFKFNRGDYI